MLTNSHSFISGSGKLRKEAFFGALLMPLAKILMWGGLGATAWNWFGSKLTSVREGLAKDIQDVIDVSASASDKTSMVGLATRLRVLLAPYAAKFRKPMPIPGDKSGLMEYNKDLGAFEAIFGEAAALVEAMLAVPDEWYKFGFGAKSRLREKFSDLRKTLDNTKTAVERLSGVAQKAVAKIGGETPTPAAGKPESSVARMQDLLAGQGLEVPRTGVLDDATKDAVRKLETKLDAALRQNPKFAEILGRRGWHVTGLLLSPEGKLADPQVAARLIALVG